MVFLNQILFKYYENVEICYVLYYLDIHQKELKSIQPLFLNPGARLLFVGSMDSMEQVHIESMEQIQMELMTIRFTVSLLF